MGGNVVDEGRCTCNVALLQRQDLVGLGVWEERILVTAHGQSFIPIIIRKYDKKRWVFG